MTARAVTAKVVIKLLADEPVDELVKGQVTNAVDAPVDFVPVSHYSVEGDEGVAYVIENDPSIQWDDVCQGAAAEALICKQRSAQ